MINRKKNFNTLSDWYNPTTWFGQPSEPPPPFTGVSQRNVNCTSNKREWSEATPHARWSPRKPERVQGGRGCGALKTFFLWQGKS